MARERSLLDHYNLRVSVYPSRAPSRRIYKERPPVGVFCLPLRLLPLRSRDFTFDGKGDAIGTWHAKAGGIASYLLVRERSFLELMIEPSKAPTFRAWQV